MNYEPRVKRKQQLADAICDQLCPSVRSKEPGVAKFNTYAEGSDRQVHGGLPLGLAKDQNRPPCVQIHSEGTR